MTMTFIDSLPCIGSSVEHSVQTIIAHYVYFNFNNL